jgi:hypothetical protein
MDAEFRARTEASLTPKVKLMLLDHRPARFLVINRRHGIEFEGLWLSSALV